MQIARRPLLVRGVLRGTAPAIEVRLEMESSGERVRPGVRERRETDMHGCDGLFRCEESWRPGGRRFDGRIHSTRSFAFPRGRSVCRLQRIL